MNTRLYAILLILLGFSAHNLNAQTSTLWLLNGKKLDVTKVELVTNTEDGNLVNYQKPNGKTKSKSADEVFLFALPDGTETILYQYNPEAGNELQVDQMREFLTGKKYLWDHHKANGYLYGGIAAGMAGVILPTLKVKNNQSTMEIPLAMLIPMGYIVASGSITLSPEKIKSKYPNSLDSDYYYMGAQEGVEKKQLKKSLIGTGIGIVTGLLLRPVIY